MADYGIFGKGSSGNSWFANRLQDFHDSTKKYDPISHYAVEWPMKGAHWLVEKSSKGLADAGVGEGFNRRLSEEANENKGNFGLGSQRMGLGILGTLGAMYGASALGGGGAAGGGSAGGGAAGGTTGAFGSSGVPWAGGIDAGAGGAGGLGYAEAGGGFVGNSEFGGSSAAGGSGIMDRLTSMAGQSGGQGGGGQVQGAQQPVQPQPTNMGNPALTAALAKLVSDQEEARKQEQQGPFARAVNYQQPQGQSLQEIMQQLAQAYAATNQGNQGGASWQG